MCVFCWGHGGWGRVVFNGKIKKALIVDMTFASHLRRCLDAHLVHIGKGIQAGVPHDSNAWNTWDCSATSPYMWLVHFQVIMNVVQMSLLQVRIFASSAHFRLLSSWAKLFSSLTKGACPRLSPVFWVGPRCQWEEECWVLGLFLDLLPWYWLPNFSTSLWVRKEILTRISYRDGVEVR